MPDILSPVRSRPDVRVAGDGPAVVLLHSSMGSKSQWNALVSRLDGRRRVVAIDLLGYGKAPEVQGPAPRFRLTDEVRRLEEIVGELLPADEAFDLVGHSYGGAVALRWAHQRPARVRSLALFEPTAFHVLPPDHPALADVRTTAAGVTAAVARGDLLEGTRRFLDFWSGPGAFDALPPARQILFAGMLPKTRLDFQAIFADPLGPADLRTLSVRTLLMGGTQSPACVHRVLDALAATLPQAVVAWVEAGHMAPVTQAERVDPWIDAWLQGLSPAGAA